MVRRLAALRISLALLGLAACTPGLSLTAPGTPATPATAWASLTQKAQSTDAPPASTSTQVALVEPCRATDLNIDGSGQSAGPNNFFSVQITNIRQTACYVQGPPNIMLVDQAGQPLDVRYTYYCDGCDPAPYRSPLPAATQTAVAHDALYASSVIGPGEKLGTLLLTEGTCKTFPPNGVRLRLTLSNNGGFMEMAANALAGGRCFAPTPAPTTKWWITISPFSRAR